MKIRVELSDGEQGFATVLDLAAAIERFVCESDIAGQYPREAVAHLSGLADALHIAARIRSLSIDDDEGFRKAGV